MYHYRLSVTTLMQKSGHPLLEKWPDQLLPLTIHNGFAAIAGGAAHSAAPHDEGLTLLIRIRRIRRLGELVLQFGADRRVEVQSLGRDLLREPLVVDLLALAARVDRRG